MILTNPCPKEENYAALFLKQVEKTPSNLAVEHNDTKLTYAELYKKVKNYQNIYRVMG